MSITQLSYPIHVNTPFGEAIAYFTHEGDGDEIYWGVFQKTTGECWWWRNQEIRLRTSLSEGRPEISPIHISEKMKKKLEPHLKRHGIV